MAKPGEPQAKSTQSKLGRGLGSLIPVPIERTMPTTTAGSGPAGHGGATGPAIQDRRSAPAAAVEPKPVLSPSTNQSPAAVVFLPIRSIQPGKYQPRGAMEQLGRTEVPAIVQSVDDQEAAELSLIENLQREDLNPMDRASALRRLADEFGLTHQDVAVRVGLDRASVSNLIRLLELDAACAALVRAGAISLGHAKVLLGVQDVSVRNALAAKAAEHDWSVRQLEAAIREHGVVPRGTSRRNGTRTSGKSAHLADLCRQLEAHLGTRVSIRVGRSRGSGELRVQFFSLDEFDGLMQRIGFKGDRMVV